MGTSLVRSGIGRTVAAVGVMLVGVAALVAPAGAQDGVAAAESAVTIVQTPSGAGGVCTPAPLGLTYTTANTAETFTLTADGMEIGTFPAGPTPIGVSVTARVLRFDVASSTGGNTGAREIVVRGPDAATAVQ